MPLERRKPSQERSKEKVDLILTSAKALIGERGNDAVSMREIAKECGIAPSSIYQYFPDKNALLEAIMSDYFSQFSQLIESSFVNVKDMTSYVKAVDKGIDQFYKMFKDEPTLATIWYSVQANTVLREMDIQDSKEKADFMVQHLCKLFPQLNYKDLYDTSFLLAHLIGSSVRLALTMGDKEGKKVIKSLKELLVLRTQHLLSGQ
jgi:AcrR family transcriptional regulator